VSIFEKKEEETTMEYSGEKKKLLTNCTAVHNKVEINAQEQLVPRSTSTRGHLNKFI